ncbi:MAG TPA: rod-binding protein [Rhizomicrobium sp.]|nr:rod-binding protein [Rhizomicrobium sp.]
MTTGTLDISAAMTMAKSQPLKPPSPTASATAADKAAKQFESVFISQLLGQMFEGIPTDGLFGGGPGEEMFRSLMIDEYGKQMQQQGGFGLAAPVARHLLQLQESRT